MSGECPRIWDCTVTEFQTVLVLDSRGGECRGESSTFVQNVPFLQKKNVHASLNIFTALKPDTLYFIFFDKYWILEVPEIKKAAILQTKCGSQTSKTVKLSY